MLFNITHISSCKLNVHLTATTILQVCQADHTMLLGEKWLSYKKDNQQLPSYLEKDSDVITFSKEQFITWKLRNNKRDQFLEIGHRAFVAGLVKNKATEGEVGVKIDGVGVRTIVLDWSELLEGIEEKQAGNPEIYKDWVAGLEKRFFSDDGEWIYGLDQLHEKALEILIEFAKDKTKQAADQNTTICRLTKNLDFYKAIVSDTVKTVIPTTPDSIWGMDDEIGGRSAQKQATKHAMAKVAGLLLPSMPVKAPVEDGKPIFGGLPLRPNIHFDGDQLNSRHIGRCISTPEMISQAMLSMVRNGVYGAMGSDMHTAMFAVRTDKSYFLSTIIEEMQKAK